MSRGLNIERDDSERLSPDDMATAREAELLAIAMRTQQRQAEQASKVHHGVCANCDEPLPPDWVYCDQDCRADHERRKAAEQRAGKGATA